MSLSMPNTWRIDTFMSGRPEIASVAAAIEPPRPRDDLRDANRKSTRDGSEVAAKLAETRTAAEAGAAIKIIHVFHIVAVVEGCHAVGSGRLPYPTGKRVAAPPPAEPTRFD